MGVAKKSNILNSKEKSQEAWQELKDKDGKTFYVNKFTKETVWVKPNFDNPWIAMQDDDGDTYFYNTITKATQWEDPNEVPDVADENMDIDSESDNMIETNDISTLTPLEQFHMLLERSGIDDTWTYESTIRRIYNDPLFKSLETASQRKQAFFDYISEHRDVMKERRESEFKTLFEEVKPKLEVLLKAGEIGANVAFEDFKTIFTKEKLSEAIIEKEFIEKAWRESLSFLRSVAAKYRDELRNLAAVTLNKSEIMVHEDTKWLEFEKAVKSNKIWTQRLAALPDIDLLDYFESRIIELEKKSNALNQRQRTNNVNADADARNSFRQNLLELKNSGELHAKSTWTSLFSKISTFPSYEKVCQANGSTPLELFWDIVEDEYDIYAADKKNVQHFLREFRINVSSDSTFDDFKSKISTKSFKNNPRLSGISPLNMKLIFESLTQK